MLQNPERPSGYFTYTTQNSYYFLFMAPRQNSTNGKPKSPRIQVVLPENLCEQLALLAEEESRTVSNMAKVLIQEGVKNYLDKEGKALTDAQGHMKSICVEAFHLTQVR